MKTSFVIGRVAGTEIRLHISMLLIVLLALPQSAPFSLSAFLWSLGLFAAIFVCITLHEVLHTLVAKFYKIEVKSITLWPLGGLAQLSRLPDKPIQALLIAAAGPLSNLLLGGVLLVLFAAKLAVFNGDWFARPDFASLVRGSPADLFLFELVVINLALGLFNLIPIYPMDGGRVLLALLQTALGDQRARVLTEVVSLVLVAGVGVYALFQRDLILALMAIFLALGALSLDAPLNRLLAPAARGNPLALLKAGDYAAVVAACTRAIESRSREPNAYLLRAIALVQMEQFDAAERDLEIFQRLEPTSSATYGLRAIIQVHQGALDQALETINVAVQLEPQLSANHNNRGWVYLKRGELEPAEANLDEAVRLNPQSANALITRSLIRYRRGNRSGARHDCEAAIRLDPREALVFDSIYLKNLPGNLDWALSYYGWASLCVEDSPLVHWGRADAYRYNNQYTLAASEYSRALQLVPGEAALYYGRALAYQQQGNTVQAVDDFQKVLQVSGNSYLLREAAAHLERITSQPRPLPQ